MLSHSGGNITGRHKVHAGGYRRESEYFNLLDSGELDGLDPLPDSNKVTEKDREKMTLRGWDEHYKELYQLHTREVRDFFGRNNPDALFCGSLDDPDKWLKIGEFLGINVEATYDAHTNKSKR